MIRIYYKDLSSDCSNEQSLAMYKQLPRERQERIDKTKKRDIAKKRIRIGYFLQQVLSEELNMPMERIQYTYGKWGKPGILSSSTHFNMSHSGRYVVVAVSDEPVGIDIEHKAKNYERVAERCFCLEEWQYIKNCDNENERKKRFLEIWTMKEAYIKYTGEGMTTALNSFNIIQNQNDNYLNLQFKTLDMSDYGLESDYIMSFCGEHIEYMVKTCNRI